MVTEMFGERRVCGGCGRPVVPDGFENADDAVCKECRDLAIVVREEAVIQGRIQNRETADLWSKRLAELKATKTAAIPDEAEHLQATLGHGGLGRRIAEDIKRVRGEDLPEEMQDLHTVSTAQLTRLYKLASDLLAGRDALVGQSDNPIKDLTEEDLLAIVTQGAFERIRNDADYRLHLLKEILLVEPDITRRIVKQPDGDSTDDN